jgi:hypothetical protein
MTGSSSPLRFVPTLTEIVRPKDFDTTDQLEQQQLADRLLQRIMPKVEAQLRNSIQVLVQDQMRLLEPRLQQAVELATRQAIAKAVTEELDP